MAKLFAKANELPDGATKEQLETALLESGYLVLFNTARLCGRKDAKPFRDGKNLQYILEQPLELAVTMYNVAVNMRQRKAGFVTRVFELGFKLAPLLGKIKGGNITFDDIKDILAEAEAQSDDEDREVAA